MKSAETLVREKLFSLKDDAYRDFTAKLIPTFEKDKIIGVRAPAIKKLSKELSGTKTADEFLSLLPHRFLEESTLHATLLSREKDFEKAIEGVEAFLPFIDNWAVCDSLSPAAFKKSPEKLLPLIDRWLTSEHPYTVRFGIKCLMNYFLDDLFDETYLQTVAAVKSDEYYVNMMIAWYFATALSKQYDAAVRYLKDEKLENRVHQKTIQKAVESYRITEEQKAFLKTLRKTRRFR